MAKFSFFENLLEPIRIQECPAEMPPKLSSFLLVKYTSSE